MKSVNKKTRNIIGCMTGTSIDGLDASLIMVSGQGLDLNIDIKKLISVPFDDFASDLRRFAEQKPLSAQEISRLRDEYSRFHVKSLRSICDQWKVDLICVHGQTVFHHPPYSFQLLNPSIIAHALKVPVVFDLRAADLAHDGQGAPITPVADYILFGDKQENRSVVNLGGFCNITRIRSGKNGAEWHERVSGFDLCSCNQILDRIARDLMNQPFDPKGQMALKGEVIQNLFDDLVRVFQMQYKDKQSLGTGDEVFEWIAANKENVSIENLARTACAAIAQTVVDSTADNTVILAGGGVNNRTLVLEITQRRSAPVYLSDMFRIPASHRESIEMAVLGALCQDGIPITSKETTRSEGEFVSGCWVFV